MTADIVIRGGTVFDGSGAPGRVADVAIADGVITRDRHRTCDGERELDASGCVGRARASSTSTRTTTRRCSGIRRCGRRRTTASPPSSPATAASRSRRPGPSTTTSIVRTLENVEDMDPATLTAGIAWDFETFPEYLDVGAPARHASLNFTAYVGHSALRLYVMGDAAYERAATADEIEQHVPRSCARRSRPARPGFSTSFSYAHRGVDGKPVPSRFADARRGRGAVPAPRARPARAWCSSRRASSAPTPTCTSGSRASGGRSPTRCSRRRAASTSSRSRCTRQGSRTARSVWPQVTPRPLTMQFTMADAYSLNTGTVFGELMKVEPRRCASPRTAIPSGGRAPRPTSRSRR